MKPKSFLIVCVTTLFCAASANAQSVCLPAPRLLTTMPMGGQVGTTLDVIITGDFIEGAEQLRFSHPSITAKPKLDGEDKPLLNQYVVTIAKDCPIGVHEARVMTRLGISSSRVFNVGSLPEATRTKSNTSLETAMSLDVDSICNAVMTPQSIDYFSFKAIEGQRIVVDCAANGIDSKLKPVVIVADETGADLMVERRGGVVDFTTPAAGTYVVKVHDLTYKGGSTHFYRLALQEAAPGADVPRLPSTQQVSEFSWPPVGLTNENLAAEIEPNNSQAEAQKVTLPLDVRGSFFPAADVDTFEFTAKKGEVWWVEVASERLGRPTDPAVVVQRVGGDGKMVDVAELNDIPSPIKVSSNGYSYDGPPYNAGSADVNGKFEIKEDGTYRLQIRDLFGGTRSDPQNVYRLIVRKASPDFALVGWSLHMGIRNGDRNALSKPIALRGGSTVAIEVLAVRRDGFNGEIELFMNNLPQGVTATAVKIPAGQSRGIMLITAEPDAPRGLTSARFFGTSTIGEVKVERRCFLASMKWPVPDASQQIPDPRLLADVPVSVGGEELAPVTIAPKSRVVEAVEGEKVTIPLVHTSRGEFSGATISLRAWSCGLGSVPSFDVEIKADGSEAMLDLAAMKTKPGEYVLAYYGSAVAKYRYYPEQIKVAQAALDEAKKHAEELRAAKATAEVIAKANAVVNQAGQHVTNVTNKAKQKDIVDIVVSTPITLRVKPK